MKRYLAALLIAGALVLSSLSGCAEPVTEQPNGEVSSEAAAESSAESVTESPFVLSEETAAKVQQMADTLISDYDVPSVQFAIISDGEIILSGGSGIADRSSQTPVTKDTMYGIGSTSKMYTVCAVMMLVDEGKVDIDKPLTEYIPEFKTKDERYVSITPRMLMNYSSGLYGTNYKNGFTLGDARTDAHDDLLENLALEGLKYEPGTCSYYGNDGITLLEILVERVSGMTFSEFIGERISKPLGLTNTYTPQDDFDHAQLAKLYHPLATDALPDDTVNHIGSGGIYSTAEEVCLVGEVLMGYRPELLSAESALEMRGEEYKKGEWSGPEEGFFAYGLGWDSVYNFPFRTYDIQAVSKGGSTLLTNSSLMTIPEHNLAMAVASSGGSAFYNNVFACSSLQEVLAEKGVIDAVAPPRATGPVVKQEMPAEFLEYSGLYGRALHDPVAIDITADGFTLADPLGLNASDKFVYIGDGKFANEDGSLTATFETAGNGSTYILLESITMLPGLGQASITYNGGQKIEGEALREEMAALWKAREGQYYVLDDAPTSQLYMGILLNYNLKVNPEYSYVKGCRITGENTAVNSIVTPMLHVACDTSDMEFVKQDGMEYLKLKGYTLIAHHNLGELDIAQPVHMIGDNGYAKWYRITDEAAGKQITVQLPEGGAFTIYDQDANGVFFSVASGTNTAVLPDGGAIAFLGAVNDEFQVTYE